MKEMGVSAPHEKDRQVHAVLDDGSEIVRYSQDRKWYREWHPDRMIPCRLLSMRMVEEFSADAPTVYFGLPGGKEFDRRVTRARVANGRGY